MCQQKGDFEPHEKFHFGICIPVPLYQWKFHFRRDSMLDTCADSLHFHFPEQILFRSWLQLAEHPFPVDSSTTRPTTMLFEGDAQTMTKYSVSNQSTHLLTKTFTIMVKDI